MERKRSKEEDLSIQVAASLLDRECRVLDLFQTKDVPVKEMVAGSLPDNYEAEIDGSLLRVLVRRCY